MSAKEPLVALGVVALWVVYGLVYFARTSKAQGREMFVTWTAGA